MATAPAFPRPRERRLFDDGAYLRLHPGIDDAIARGDQESAWRHYDTHGRAEGRRTNDVDPAFYARAYPRAAETGLDAAAHYVLHGKARGYLAHPTAPRVSDFGQWGASQGGAGLWGAGLWIDRPDALDVVDGRLALGRLNRTHADLLRALIVDGYCTIERAVDKQEAIAATLDIDRMLAGACPDMLIESDAMTESGAPIQSGATGLWNPDIALRPAAVLDPHYFSRAIREAIFSETIALFLGTLFDAPALLTSSRASLREPDSALRRDIHRPAHTMPGQAVTLWLALEDAAGEDFAPVVYPGAHRRFPPDRFGADASLPDPLLNRAIAESASEACILTPPAGAAVLFHPASIRGWRSGAPLASRRGLTARLCPHHISPLYAETTPTKFWRHAPHGFTSGLYPGLEPTD